MFVFNPHFVNTIVMLFVRKREGMVKKKVCLRDERKIGEKGERRKRRGLEREREKGHLCTNSLFSSFVVN